jgi:hypothetical protein
MLRCFSNRIQGRRKIERFLSKNATSTRDYGPTRHHTHRMFSTPSSSDSRRGSLFIGLGWTLLGLLALDQALQYRQQHDAKERLEILASMQQEADEMNQVDWDRTLPSLFECKILHVEASLDGIKMLSNIRVGDVVEIIEESVGPNKAYHLGRRPAQGRRKEAIGWYPIQMMELI